MYLQRCLLLCCSFFLWFALPCESRDIIKSSLKYGETIVSAGKRFELGFFSPEAEGANIYVGIWYYQRKPQTVVWVANRDSPCSDSSGSIIAIKDANFTGLSRNGSSCFSIAIGQPSNSNNNWTAQLLDSGNLVFIDGSGETLWQSFDYPTDTFLPGMKMKPGGFKLSSWKNSYTFQQDERTGQYIISSGESAEFHWKSGDPLASSVVEEVSFLLSNFSTTFITKKSNSNHNYLNYPSLSSFNDTTYMDTRLLMNSSGEIQFYIWDKNWKMPWHEPQDNCSVYNFCGSFGTCSNELPCNCLAGYEPKHPNKWKDGKYSNGCSWKAGTSCSPTDTFLNLSSIKIGYPYPSPDSNKNESECISDCLGDCECRAYSFSAAHRNLEHYGCRIWNELNDLQEDFHHGLNLFVRLSAPLTVSQPQGPSRERKESSAVSKSLAIYILAVVAFVLSCSLGCIVYKRKLAGRRGEEIILGMPNIGMQEQDLITEDDKKKIEVPFFRLGTILQATDNFSNANKLGQGGFGPVYKGNFLGGQTIAVKRLLSNCGQGVDEFKNEVMLIAKLQHRNLVKLLGYCITTNEKILLYEYMPNKSLDFIIFDRQLSVLLDWKMRFDIILGIARGLLYLHQDSRLRIIHRYLKVSNILLDEEMNPKISDFGLARIVEGKSIEANTNKVVGTLQVYIPYILNNDHLDKY